MAIRFERLNKAHYELARNFRVNPSSCANPEYFAEYLQFVAFSDLKKGLGTTHLLIEEENGVEKVLGYITLRASSYTRDLGEIVLGEPALEIFELAVADGEEKRGVGTALIKFAIGLAMIMREETAGVRYLLVCATERAYPFYEKNAFGKIASYGQIPRDQMNQNCIPMHMELPMENH